MSSVVFTRCRSPVVRPAADHGTLAPTVQPDRATIMAKSPNGADLGPCPLCGRPMVDGPGIDRHHWVPKTEGGREQSPMHQVCHRKIHAVLSEKDLASEFADPAALRSQPEIARFVAWVQRKPPEWNDWHRSPRRR